MWGVTVALNLNPIIVSRIGYALGESNVPFWTALALGGLCCGVAALAVHQHEPNALASHPRKMLIFVKSSMPGAYLFAKGFWYAPSLPDERAYNGCAVLCVR